MPAKISRETKIVQGGAKLMKDVLDELRKRNKKEPPFMTQTQKGK